MLWRAIRPLPIWVGARLCFSGTQAPLGNIRTRTGSGAEGKVHGLNGAVLNSLLVMSRGNTASSVDLPPGTGQEKSSLQGPRSVGSWEQCAHHRCLHRNGVCQ